jgi:ATP-dependent Clp protease ATP-binding subunit ClpB
MGPSGVGKTKLAKELAAFMFDTPDALTQFDMSEYQERHHVTNLIGSARGFVGSDSGGLLTEAIRRRPYSVVLFDEIEKAHPDVFNILLPAFDEGRITDNRGRAVDCANVMFIMTSNIGAGDIDFTKISQDELRQLAGHFLRPELVNRITDVIGFMPLQKPDLARILDQVLTEKIAGFRVARNIVLTVDDQSKAHILAAAGHNAQMGARPIERAVDDLIVQPFVDAIFSKQVEAGAYRATFDGGRIVFRPHGV